MPSKATPWISQARRSLSPATDQMWLPSTAAVHGPVWRKATAVGPSPHLSVVSRSLEPVGSSITGPMPQIQPRAVGTLGEKKKLCTVSLMPV